MGRSRASSMSKAGPSRSGFTLMEMLTVITAMSAISVTGALLVGVMLTAETKGARTALEQTTLGRIGRQLRLDAHAAASATFGESDAAEPRLEMPAADGRTIRWTAGSDGVLREVVAGDQRVHREEYRLAEGAGRFEIDEEAGLVAFIHASPAAPLAETYSTAAPPGPDRIVRIEAALNIENWTVAGSGNNEAVESVE